MVIRTTMLKITSIFKRAASPYLNGTLSTRITARMQSAAVFCNTMQQDHFSSDSGTATPLRRLESQVVVITGGASGIGRASAQLFAQEGAKVIIADIQDELGSSLAKTLGPFAHYKHCDVTKEEDLSSTVDFAVSRYGSLDVMFNNAGIAGQLTSSITQLDSNDFDKLISVNLRGMLLGTKHAARVMIPEKKGSIICVSSITALIAGGAPHPYTISKHAVIGLVKSVASELRQYGIRVNCISPYAITTPFVVDVFRKMMPGITEETISNALNKSCGFLGAQFEPEEVARAALFLASEEARFVSGHNLVLDGAYSVSKSFNPFQELCQDSWHS